MAFLRTSILLLCVFAAVQPKSYRQTQSAIQDVEDYIARKKPEINPRYRLHYHVMPPVGWMNDPNGFSYYKGEFHLFYQFYPYDSVWGPMHWGHSSSSNLVDWNVLPTALVPDKEQCFSGSGVVVGDTLVLMYTAHESTDTDPFYNETQFLAFSDDGITFEKYAGNPVLPLSPNGSPDFRDPKVWKNGDYYYVILGSKTLDQRGMAVLYKSLDLKAWEFIRVLGESDGSLGYMWECPDFFELNGRYVLLMSPQGMAPQGDRYKNTHQTGFIIGSFNYDNFEFVPETEFQEIDYGHDFYASQTTLVDGKRYLVAWFSMWEVNHNEDVDGWAGAMTMIRELEIIGDRVVMKPVDDIVSLRHGLVLHGDFQQGQVLDFEKTAEINIQVDLGQNLEVLLTGSNGGDRVTLRWDPNVRKVVVDRNGDIRQVEWNPIGPTSMRLFLDASSLELFCGKGEVVFSSRAYPDGDWRVTNQSPQVLPVEAHKLRRSVPV